MEGERKETILKFTFSFFNLYYNCFSLFTVFIQNINIYIYDEHNGNKYEDLKKDKGGYKNIVKGKIEITRHGKREMAYRIVCNDIDGRRGIRETRCRP